jgi:hypothetical protein
MIYQNLQLVGGFDISAQGVPPDYKCTVGSELEFPIVVVDSKQEYRNSHQIVHFCMMTLSIAQCH